MWEAFNTQCYESNENPDCICFRDVTNDIMVSPWYAWQGIKPNPTFKEFCNEVEKEGLNPENLVLRSYHDDNETGIVLDYRLRKQFWIPNPVGWDLDYLTLPIEKRCQNKSEIKPCPFCGGEAIITVMQEMRMGGNEGWVIKCNDCGANTVNINGNYTAWRENSIELWNRRANLDLSVNEKWHTYDNPTENGRYWITTESNTNGEKVIITDIGVWNGEWDKNVYAWKKITFPKPFH